MSHEEKKRDRYVEVVAEVKDVDGPTDIDALYQKARIDFAGLYTAMDEAWPELRATNASGPFAAGVVAGVLYGAKARELLRRFVEHEDQPCRFDHHGYCQEHGTDEPPCAVRVARQLLGLDDG